MLKLSPSSIQQFKNCSMAYYLSEVLGLQPIEEKESFRIGGLWHKLHEIKDLDEVIKYLDKVYATVPNNKTHEDWLTERTILLYSLIGYRWYYSNQKIKRIASEIKFRVIVGTTVLVGRMDEIIQLEDGRCFIRERKSTSSEIDGSSDYWNRIGMDTQISTYLYAAPQVINLPISGLFYDVWHRPKIKPKKLTQAESKKFVETGEYCGQKFNVILNEGPDTQYDQKHAFLVDDECTITEPGAKEGTFTLYETSKMFGARLLEDITNRPEYYFQCREISRTDKQLQQFEKELNHLSKVINGIKQQNLWWCNENSCHNRYRCDFVPICFNNIEIDLNNLPEGFKLRS